MTDTKTNELFKPEQLEQLRDHYGKINSIDPCLPTYKKLIAMLASQPKERLQQLAKAEIKWVSMIAKNRL